MIAGSIWLLQGSAVPSARTTASPSPTLLPNPSPVSAARNLQVEVTYSNAPQFRLAIGEIGFVSQPATVDHFAPPLGAPYAVVRVLGERGENMMEKQITITTAVLLESVPSQDGRLLSQPIYAFPAHATRIVMPLSEGQKPRTVVLVSDTGQILAEKTIVLPGASQSSASQSPAPTSSGQPLSTRLLSVLSAPAAQAQINRRFTIVVTNERGGTTEDLTKVVNELRAMMGALEPWKTYQSRIEVVPLFNTQQTLACTLVYNMYPYCSAPDVMPYVAQLVPQWSTIVVVHGSTQCNCGSVENNFTPVISTGVSVDKALLGHLLGHSVGKLADEHLYQTQVTNNWLSSNCFASEAACRLATERFLDATCTQGCSTVSSWRSSSKLMHHTYTTTTDLSYGSFEQCQLGERLGRFFGEMYQCLSLTSTPSPVVTPPQPTPPLTEQPQLISLTQPGQVSPSTSLCFVR